MYTKGSIKRLFATVVCISAMSLFAFSQVDYEFWFAAPYGNTDHAPYWPQSYPYKVGGRPIYLRIATQDADADVTVSLPALGLTIANVSIPANSTESIDLTPYISDIQCSKSGDIVEDKGLYIRSNAVITAYYEIASVLNTDIFSLKGQNALGKEFYTPFQNKMSNDPYHNGEGVPDNGISGDGAYSYIVIVATQDHTVINVTPTTNCVGISAGTTKSVTLDRGQTYVVRATGQDASSRMSGTHIKSTKPIAVTIGEDSVYPDYYTNSGDCEDYVGDQLTPVDVTGTDYLIVQGQGYSASKSTGNNFYELVTITATQDNTTLTVDGAQYGSTLKKGQSVSIELTDPNSIYTFIKASKPVYAFHVSGYHCEVAGALLPSVELCTGSHKMGFVRTYGSQNDQEFYMNLMVKGDGEKDFLLNGVSNSVINNADFQAIDGTEWKVARIYFNQSDMPEGAYFLQNPTSLFHMGMMNSTAHDWGDGQGYRLMGSMYGYFSRFSDNYPTAVIVSNNDTSITVTRNTKVSLLADGGYEFSWKGYMWDGYDWQLMDAPYYLNDTDAENPYVRIDAIGVYKYVATITTDCYGDVEKNVLIKIVEPVDLNDIDDTVCYTPGLSPENNMSQYYNLFNLNDTIVGKKGLLTGFYVDHFDKLVAAANVVWDDYDKVRPISSSMSAVNGSFSTTTLTETILDGYKTEIQTHTETQIVTEIDPDTGEEIEVEKEVEVEEEVEVPITHEETRTVGHLVKNNQQWYTLPGLSGNDAQNSSWLSIDLSSKPIKIENSSTLEFDVKYDGASTQWSSGSHTIYLELVDQNDNCITTSVASFPTYYQGMSSAPVCDWEHVSFDFSNYEDMYAPIKTIRIRGYFNGWVTGYGYYLDNLKYSSKEYKETILGPDARNYTITDVDTIYAIVKNNFEITRSDTSMVFLHVKNSGIKKRTIDLGDTCATEGATLKEFNLQNFNYNVGGALVANRDWYFDYQKTKKIEDPEFVDVPAGENIFYAYIQDECEDIPGELLLNVYPIPEVMDGEVTVCEIPQMGGDQGVVDLDENISKITTDVDATVQWYSDSQYTKLMGSTSSVPVTDGTTFYAKVYYSNKCASFAKLTVNLTPVDDIVFEDFSVCADGDPVVLNATPTGGTYAGTGVSMGSFDPAVAGVGTHEISYTITNEGCINTEKANVTVNPEVSVDLKNLSGKLQQGQTANLQATITPSSSDYVYTWSDASLLQSSNTLTPKTIALNEPTYYTIDVENKVTGCTATAKVLVDVYAPVKVTLNLTPVCSGTDVTIEAERTGGTGPFTYVWNLDPAVSYTSVNDSVITIPSIASNVDVSVTVTDKTEGDVRDAKATQEVYENPVIDLSGEEVCQGADLTLQPTVTGGKPTYEYSWTGNTEIITSSLTAQNATINTNDNVGTYYVTFGVEDQNGCTASKTAEVLVNQKPVVSAASESDVSCLGEPVNLSGSVVTGSSNGASYQWIAQQAYSLEGLSDATIPNPTFASYITGVHQFQMVFTDAEGCKDTSDVVNVTIQPRPQVTINPVPDQCVSNMGVQLSAVPSVTDVPDATFTYEWSGDVTSTEATPMLDISTPGEKHVNLKVTASNGCVSDEVKATVLVNPNPLAEIATKDMSVCAEDTTTLQANSSATDVTYTWEATATLLSTTGSSVQIVPSNPIGSEMVPHTITLTVTDNKTGCQSTTTTGMTAFRLPEITLGDDIELCDGASIELEPLVKYAYQGEYITKWYLDTLQLSSTNVMNPIYTQKGTDIYNIGIEISDKNGCKGFDQLDIYGLQNPTANAGEDRIEDWGQEFTLFGSATGGTPAYSYLWSPADSLVSSPTVQNATGKLLETNIYTLEVTDAKGCKDTAEVTITIIGQPLKVSILQKPDPYCFGNTAVLEALPSGGTGVYKYEWYKASDLSTVIGTDKTLEIAPTDNTVYKVVLNSVGEKYFEPASATHTVTVYSLPTVALRGEELPHVCKDNTITLVPAVSGVEPFSYQWMDGSPIVVKTETYMFSNSQAVGNKEMKLIVTDAMGCSDSLSFNVYVDELPSVTVDPVTECVHVETEIEAKVSNGAAPYTYVWTGLDGATSNGSIEKYTATESGTYITNVMVVDANGCSSEAEAIITIKPESDLSLDPTYSVCASADLTLDINPNNIPGTYVMHWVGGDKNRIVDSTIVTRSLFRSENEGNYTLYYTIADEYNCPKENSVDVTVYPAVKLADIDDLYVCASADLPITAEIATGNPTNYSWLGNVSPKDAKTTTFSYNKEGDYEVTVIAGDQHCSDTKVFNVAVQPNPEVEIIGAPIKVVDYTASVALTSQLTKYTTSPFTHSWSDAANIASATDVSVITTKPIMSTTDFVYTLTDKYGCTASANITLQTEVIIPKITRLCDGTEYSVSENELVDADVVCLVDDALELCIGESAYLIPQFVSGRPDGLHYAWRDDDNNYLGEDINLLIKPTKDLTVYTLTVSNDAGFSTDVTFTVLAHPNPTASITVSPEYNGLYYTNGYLVIDGNPSSAEYGVDFVSHQWTAEGGVELKNPTSQKANIYSSEERNPVTLTYAVVDQNGCKAETTREISIVNQKMPVIVGNDVCVNSSAVYSLDIDYPSGSIYVWSVEGGTILGDANASSVEVLWNQTENTNLTVSVYPSNDRPIEGISRNVIVTPYPDVAINGQIHVCVGESATYQAVNNIPSMNLIYAWSVLEGNGDITDITHPISDMATITWDKEGEDSVILQASHNACPVYDTLAVYIHPTPMANFTYYASEEVYFMEEDTLRHTDSIFVDKEVTFTNLTKKNDNFDFFWDFIGDGVYTENAYNTVYEYDEVGDFTVSLMVVENTWGCKNVVAKPLKVVPNPNCGMTFPNAFTPDLSDNNTFYPVFKTGVLESGYELRVYNRWGTLLWSTTDLAEKWDGSYKGAISKQDVYVYHCKAVCEDVDPSTGEHRVLNVKGDVTIIR